MLQDHYPLPDVVTQSITGVLDAAFVAIAVLVVRRNAIAARTYLIATTIGALGFLAGIAPLANRLQPSAPLIATAIESLILALALATHLHHEETEREQERAYARDLKHARERTSTPADISANAATEVDDRAVANEHDNDNADAEALHLDDRTRIPATHLDGITDIPNRTALDEHLTTAWEHARTTQTPLAALLVDIDRFHQYNDLYGHLAGDDVIRRIAAALTATTSAPTPADHPACVTGRYAGDKFLILLPHAGVPAAKALAADARSAVAALDLAHGAIPSKRVTVSIGLAAVTPTTTGADAAELLRRAGTALHIATTMGRNREVADEPIAPPVAFR